MGRREEAGSQPLAGGGFFASLSSLLSLSDEEAMLRVKDHGDHHAFSVLLRRWEGRIQRLSARMVGDAHLGEDLAQEAFARLFAYRLRYRAVGRFSTFLWRVALNVCFDELRKRRASHELPVGRRENGQSSGAISPAASEPSPDEFAVENERAALVREALSDLPERCRAVVILRHYEQLRFREIAEVLNVPEGTAKSRMAEALSRLADALRPKFGTEGEQGEAR